MASSKERSFLEALSTEYAWSVADTLVRAGRVVGGTPKSRSTAEWIRNRMIHEIGFPSSQVALEEFPVVGYALDEATAADSVGATHLEIDRGGEWESIPAVQAMKGPGTGPNGVSGPVIDVGEGRLEDFRRSDVRDRVVLFSATDALFYGAPVQETARARGAIAAIVHWPIAPDDALRLHTMSGTLPLVSIRNVDAARIRARLANGTVRGRLTVDNRWEGTPHQTGINVVGTVLGATHPEEFVYLCAHFDHWFSSAADNNAGVGSLLAIAKAFVDLGFRPKRTIVFVAFDAEELGGWADSWYDWLIGSYAHIVASLRGPALHANRRGHIVAMMNMDVVGTRGAEALIESTPEFTPFLRRVARDSGLSRAVPTKVYWPPTSYDDWPFFVAGAAVSQIAWWGPAYEPLYHTTADTMETLDRENVRLNLAFNGLGVLRVAQSDRHPYDFRETIRAIRSATTSLRDQTPTKTLKREQSRLERSLAVFEQQIRPIDSVGKGAAADRQNYGLRKAIRALNPRLFAWDFATPLPGWAGVSRLANPTRDWAAIQAAIEALRSGRGADASTALLGVATMQWGRFMDYEGYRQMLRYVADEKRPHMLWGRGFVPKLTDIHREWESISRKVAQGNAAFAEDLSSLEHRADEIVEGLGAALRDMSSAVAAASRHLSTGTVSLRRPRTGRTAHR